MDTKRVIANKGLYIGEHLTKYELPERTIVKSYVTVT